MASIVLVVSAEQWKTIADNLEVNYDEFLEGNGPISVEKRYPTAQDTDTLALLKMFHLVSEDSRLDSEGYLIGSSHTKDFLDEVGAKLSKEFGGNTNAR